MSVAWQTVALLALATAAIRGAGPALVGGRALPPRVMTVIALLAPALLAALVVVQTLGTGDGGLAVDARLAGLTAAAAAIAARQSVLVVVLAAAVVTAVVRAVS